MKFLVNPVPPMQRQKDLNRGSYCKQALLDYWFQKPNGRSYGHLNLNLSLGESP
ncbi:MAG: hypothetical protein IPK63_14315 [Candidatus Competibacteraceae bacterium]|nr:hypothetical protein [Candidatus Competibacteraceae bacterium]